MRERLYSWIHRVWYGGAGGYWFLLPLSGLFWLAVRLRAWMYAAGLLRVERLAVPVIVVGNIVAGGTGKTPLTVWLSRELRSRGYRPGIVSRGYGGSHSGTPMRVDAASDSAVVGDEPVLLARQSGCPVAVDTNRVRAARMLVEDGCDLLIADDGLQHLRLGRDYEVCVVDGERWLGNRLLLPAGPLREPAHRLAEVDQVAIHGHLPTNSSALAGVQTPVNFELAPGDVRRINGTSSRPLAGFVGQPVHAVAGIGNPGRFFAQLREAGMDVIEHPLRDHAILSLADLEFGDGLEVIMTEKDAVKLGREAPDRLWYLPVQVAMRPVMSGPWLGRIEESLRTRTEQP